MSTVTKCHAHVTKPWVSVGCWPACLCFSWSLQRPDWFPDWCKSSFMILALSLFAPFVMLMLSVVEWVLFFLLSLFTCREPDIPAWAPLLYQLQLLDVREKPDPLTLPVADRIRIGNQKRERGNFHFQREEYSMAVRAYSMALDVLITCGRGLQN